jgi:hypothetical protein
VSSGGALRRRHFDREMRQAEVDGRAARAGGDRQGRVERTEEPASQPETEAQTAATLGTRRPLASASLSRTTSAGRPGPVSRMSIAIPSAAVRATTATSPVDV